MIENTSPGSSGSVTYTDVIARLVQDFPEFAVGEVVDVVARTWRAANISGLLEPDRSQVAETVARSHLVRHEPAASS